MDYNVLREMVTNLGYPWYDRGLYNLNVVGIRKTRQYTDLYDDVIAAVS